MSLARKFATVGAATMTSRLLGFVREVLIAGLLGAGPVADAFYAAFRFPNLFRRLFAEGAFNSAFIPMFSRELETGGQDAAREFAERILSVFLVVLIGLSAMAMIFMPFLVGTVIAPKFASDPQKFDLTVFLARIMFPYLAAMSLVAMFSGILNAFRKYFLAALAPVLLNVVLVGVLLLAWQMGMNPGDLGVAMAWGVLVSGILQLLLLVFALYRQDFKMTLRTPAVTPAVKRLVILAVPTAIAGGITQINLLVGQIIASAQSGAIAMMNYADRLIQLPLGIIGISIGVVLLPELTRALARNDDVQSRHLQNRSLEFGMGLTVPAAAGLFTMALPIVVLIYERGAFDRQVSETTATVLQAFSVGLPAFVLIKILQPAFYAREDMKTPMWYSGINALVNISLSLYLFPIVGVMGLAAATSVAGWINATLLAFSLARRRQLDVSGETLRNVVLIVVSSAIMAAGLLFGLDWQGQLLTEAGIVERAVRIFLLIGAAALVYILIVLITGAVSSQDLKRLIHRA